ncbi:MAG: hypothetical protein J6W55_02910 [Acidaminococcaceae bacterium]|nr:hypothetical protein [Acidaminococcaceae bacterium]
MAKYLGGIRDRDIDVVGIARHFFDNDFDVQYYDYKLDTLTVQKRSIAKSVIRFEEVTAETLVSPDRKMTGALAGYLAGGPVWGVIGAVLGGSQTANEKHVILCELDNGWQFALELDKNEYIAWCDSVGEAVKTRPLIEGNI